jgi:hypothetical protein
VETLGATRNVTVAGSNTQTYGSHAMLVASNRDIDVGSTLSTTVNGTVFQLFGGNLSTNVTGTQTSNVSAGMLYLAPSYTLLAPDGTKVDNLHIKITGLGLQLVGVEAQAAALSLSLVGVAADAIGIDLKLAPIKIRPITAKIQMRSLKVSSAGFWMHMKAFTCIV